jgi:hypothetical protein
MGKLKFMPKLMKLAEWRNAIFIAPRPSLRTCQKWCEQGLIVGSRKYGHLWFVDVDLYNQSTGNPLVDSILNKQG